MDSLNKARDLKDLHKRLVWQFQEAKGLNSDGSPASFQSGRKLEMVSTTTAAHNPKSPHSLTFRLSAQIYDRNAGLTHLNDPRFLAAIAKAITNKLPELLDDVLGILKNECNEAFRAAEKEIQSSQQRLEALRPEVQTQQELI